MLASIIYVTLTAVASLGAAAEQTPREFSWHQIERHIQRHRDQVRWCGPLSAIRLLQLAGHRINAESVLRPFQDGEPRGVPIHRVLRLCRTFMPYARAVRVPARQLNRLTTPCILFVNEGRHALVLQSWSRISASAEIWDPSDLQTKRVPLHQLRDWWSGDAIVMHDARWLPVILGIVNALIAATILLRWRKPHRYRQVED